MQSVREIAYAYYEKATEEEVRQVQVLFTELDVNGDGQVSLAEFKTYMSTKADPHRLSDFFKLLNANGDGMLEFPDIVTCFYIRKYDLCAGWRNCAKCSCVLLSVPYFSCSLCDYPDIYDLCCDCYRQGKFKHKHSYEFFKDNYSSLSDRGKKTEITNGKNALHELHDIAKCHYRAGSPDVQQRAYEFFQSMDYDGDGKVDLYEFLAFMRQEGYIQMRNSYFFRELDHDGNGTLDFSEVMTLYYIIKSKRPFCDGCGKFIPGVYFLCVECFNIPTASFTLCCDCYRSPTSRCSHDHGGRTQFLDNYTLLQAKNDMASVATTLVNLNEGLSHPVNYSQAIIPAINSNLGEVYTSNEPSYNSSYTNMQGLPHSAESSNAIVPANNSKWSKCSTALKLLEVAVHIGIASASCTIL